MKRCTRCNVHRPVDQFCKYRRAPSGLSYNCLECRKANGAKWRADNHYHHVEQRREWTRDNPRRQRDQYLRATYRISVDDFDRMFADQAGLCAICHQPETALWRKGRVRNLSIDHNHDTGRVRGLLCSACNAGIGHLRHNIDNLHTAIDYLLNDLNAESRNSA